MHQSFEKNLITTKDAGELSGYSSDYLSRLVRTGKVSGEKVGHSWLVDKKSLEQFLNVHGNNKIERARELASERAREYRAHRSLLHRTTKSLTKQVSVPEQFNSAASPFASHVVALATALLVVVSGALVAQAGVIPQLAEKTMSLMNETAAGFGATFGDIPARITANINTANDAMRASVTKVAATNQITSAQVASLVLAEPDLSTLRMMLDDSHQTFRSASLPEASPFISNAPVITLADVRASVFDAISFFTSPSNLARAYVGMGEQVYTDIGATFATYDLFIETSGATTLALAASTRDTLATFPNFVRGMNLAIGESVIVASHAAIRADVATAYWTAAAAPTSARATVAFIGTIGDTLARAASHVPALATTAYLRAVATPTVFAPAIAQAVFDVEYTGATRFVALANGVSSGYLALIKDTGDVAYGATAGVRGIRDTYFGAIGKGVVTIDTVKKISFTGAVINATQPTISFSKQAALATYETIHGFFSSASDALAAFFTTTPEIILPTGVPKTRVITVAVSTSSPQATAPRSYVSYPSFTTVVQGVSADVLNQSLASLRTEMSNAIANQIRPVAAQTATNIQTIQMVNKIERLNELTVTNGTFTGGSFTGGSTVSATSGSFTNLTVSGTATSTFAGNLSVSGNINLNGLLLQNNAPFIGSQWTTSGSDVYYTTGNVGIGSTTPTYKLSVEGTSSLGNQAIVGYLTATSTTATSTFAGNLAVGTTSPWGNGLFTVGTSTPLLYVSSNTGRIGIGTSTPASSFDIYGTDALHLPVGVTGERPSMALTGQVRYNTTTHQFEGYGDNAVWQGLGGVINAAQTSYITAGTDDFLRFVTSSTERMTITSAGLVGIGSTTPFANFSLAGTAGGTTNLFAVSTSTAGSATTTALTIDQNGNLALLGGANFSVGGNTTLTGTLAQTGLATFTNGFLSNASSTITSGLFRMDGGASTTQVTSSGSSYFATSGGNVGVGNTVPAYKLDVTGTGHFSGVLALSTIISCAGAQAVQTDGSGNLACGNIAGGSLSTAAGWVTDSIGNVTLSTTTDRVGLGATTTPYAKLSIMSGNVSTTTLALLPVGAQTANVLDIYDNTGVLNSVITAAGRWGIGTTAPDASAILDITSTTGGLLVPRLTTVQKTAIAAPAAGLTLYDSTLNKLNVYNGSAWKNVGSTEINGEVTNGTQGSVLFIGDGAVLGQSTSFNFSTSTGFLGIGTTSPFANLSLAGTAGGTTNLFAISTSTAGFATTTAFTIDQNGNLSLLNGSNLSVGGTLTQSGLATFTNGFLSNASSTITSGLFRMDGGASTTQLTVTGDTYLATASGNVGIGTTTPWGKLSIELDTSTPGFVVANQGSTTPSFYIGGVNQNGFVGIGTTTTPSLARFILDGSFTNETGSSDAVAGIHQFFTFSPTIGNTVQVGNRMILQNNPAGGTATNTAIAQIIRVIDSSNTSNLVRGLDVTANGGNNNYGVNTAIRGSAGTFGLQGLTTALAGGTSTPAAIYGENTGTTESDVLRLYSATMTNSASNFARFYQDSSAFTGTGLLMNFAAGGGSFSGNFMDLQNNSASAFKITNTGTTTVGSGSGQAGLQIGFGGLCVDNDGSCAATTAGTISAVAYATAHSDLAEVYYSNEPLVPGDIVYSKGTYFIGKAGTENEARILGAVSTNAGLTLGHGERPLSSQAEYPVGLSGRIPVKVTNENGPIHAGDKIVISSVAGAGMKQGQDRGTVIGIALEDFDGNQNYLSAGSVESGIVTVADGAPICTTVSTADAKLSGGVDIENTSPSTAPAVPKEICTQPKVTITPQNKPVITVSTTDGTTVREGQILVFLGLSWSPKIADTIQTGANGTIGIGTDATDARLTVSGNVFATSYEVPLSPATAWVNGQASSTSAAEIPATVLTVMGTVDLYKLATYNLSGIEALVARLDAQDVHITSLETRMNALLSGAISSASGSPITLSTTALASALEAVGTYISKGFAQFGTLIADKFVAATNSAGTSSAGTVTILAGNTAVQVNNSYVLPTSKIFATLTASTVASWYISDKQNGSFKLVLSTPQSSDVSFDYFIVQTEGQTATSTSDNVQSSTLDISFQDQTSSSGSQASSEATIIVISSTESATNTTATTTATSTTDTATTTPATTTTPPTPSDTVPPVVTLNGAAALELTVGDTFTDLGATATDDVDGDLTNHISVSGSVDTLIAGSYFMTYSATDVAGNTGSVGRMVTVVAAPAAAAATSTPAISI